MKNSLHDDISKIDWDTPDSVINFYWKHEEDLNPKKADTIEKISWTLEYVFALDKKGLFDQAKNILNQLDLEKDSLKSKNEYSKVKSDFLFANAIIYSRIKKPNKSQKYIIQAMEINPNDKLYIKWFNANREWKIKNMFKYFVFVGAAIVILNIITNRLIVYPKNLFIVIQICATSIMLGGYLAFTLKNKLYNKYEL